MPPVASKSINELKALYGKSQVESDELPGWGTLPNDVLVTHSWGNPSPGGPAWSSMIVLTPTMKALVDLDPGAKVDLKAKTLHLPKFGKTLGLNVLPKHLE